MNNLYEILIPTKYGDNLKPVKTVHHKEWDKKIQSITGGLTILAPAKGKWIHKGIEYPERVIPVRIMCPPDKIDDIIKFTIKHYRQLAVMYYVISNKVFIVRADEI